MNNIEQQIIKLQKTIQESNNTIQKLEIEKQKYIEEQQIVEEGYDIDKLNIYCKEITEFINQKKCGEILGRCKGNCMCDEIYKLMKENNRRSGGNRRPIFVPTIKECITLLSNIGTNDYHSDQVKNSIIKEYSN